MQPGGKVFWLVLVLSVFSFPFRSSAGVMYVKPEGSDNNTGTSWALAIKTVQAGLNAADNVTNTQVWVAAGTYNERITLKKGVALYGGFAGTETDLSQRDFARNTTILDGQYGGSVVTSPDGADNTTRIDGFTIRHGTGTVYGSFYAYGGGINCLQGSSATIANNTITENNVTGVSQGYGGGIGLLASHSLIINNIISGNTIGGCSFGYGGGIYSYGSFASIVGNTISGNIAHSAGGGIYCDSYSFVRLAGNIIAFNDSGIYSYASQPVLRNNCVYNPGGDNYTNLLPGAGDISLDPLFTDRINGNFHILAGSPCINAGSDKDTQSGWLDMDGEPRMGGLHVDIGADEWYPAGDCNCDYHVTVADVAIVLGALDRSAGEEGYDGRADLDGDDSITSTDLSVVLTNME